jgi:hypothetical protein
MTDRALMKKDQLASQDRSDGRAVKRTRQSPVSTFLRHLSVPAKRGKRGLGDSASAAASILRCASRAMLGAISSSRCQTTRVRLMPLATSTCDTTTDAETFFISDEHDPTGGARRDRTDDLLLAKQALSQLSYGPKLNVLAGARLPL